ncbi:MAG TPA: LPS export ABC transporter periplasmic protein LptC [Cytophagaceae bacterium]|jgi:LPS export ABC transporter protein LptC|nr:LPS export ABC transporter periplasmic protein LptC [Cytophagaceae bacterium]
MFLLHTDHKFRFPKHPFKFISIFAFLVILSGCFNNTKTMEEMKPYEGPLMELDTMETIYSDEAETKVRLISSKQLALQNGNREFPKGVLVEFYENGKITSTLTSNFARFYRDANKYMVSGNVIIKNLAEEKRLNTEELFWMPAEQRVLVEEDKQVIITTKTDVLYGKGLDATQDFSKYKILHPSGTTTIQ